MNTVIIFRSIKSLSVIPRTLKVLHVTNRYCFSLVILRILCLFQASYSYTAHSLTDWIWTSVYCECYIMNAMGNMIFRGRLINRIFCYADRSLVQLRLKMFSLSWRTTMVHPDDRWKPFVSGIFVTYCCPDTIGWTLQKYLNALLYDLDRTECVTNETRRLYKLFNIQFRTTIEL